MTGVLLTVDKLTVQPLQDATVPELVSKVSFSVALGEIYSLVGESGSGKTITSRAILGLLPPGLTATGGRIVFDGHDLLRCPVGELLKVRGRRIGMVFQEPMTSLNPALTVGRQLTEAQIRHLGLGEQESRRAAVDMLERMQVPDALQSLAKYPHEFSGGLRQRILLAGVLALRPSLIIADEPTTALDVLIQKDVLDLMVAAVRDIGSAVLLITHDLGVVAKYADRVGVMQRGRLLEEARAEDLLHQQHHAYTRELFGAIPVRDHAATGAAVRGSSLVTVENLAVDYYRRRRLPWRPRLATRALEHIDLTVHAGETVAIVGESGSGKTTLAKALLRLIPTAAGTIKFGGEDITRAGGVALRKLRRRMQIVFQDPYSALDPRMRLNDIVAEGLRHLDLDRTETARRVQEALDDVGLDGFGMRFPHQLSGGQRQRVNIARALVSGPELVLADEPVSALDVTVQAEILRLFERLQKKYGFACLFISHDLGVVEQIADRVMVIYRGQMVEIGTRDQLFDRPHHPYTCALLNAAPRLVRIDDEYCLAPETAIQRIPGPEHDYDGWSERPALRAGRLIRVDKEHYVLGYPTRSNSAEVKL